MNRLVPSAGALVIAVAAYAQTLDAPRMRIGPLGPTVDSAAVFRATVTTPPDNAMLARGRLVAMGGARDGGPPLACLACHGAMGAGDVAGGVPRISGLPAWYLYKQLDDYAAGTRPNEVMQQIAQKLAPDEREAVSAYYAAMPPAPVPPGAPEDVRRLQWGQTLAAIGSAEKAIPACVNCHGAQGEGIPPSVPGVAGQHAAYIQLQLELWRSGERRNDPLGVMSSIARKMEPADIEAVAAYYARVRWPGTDVNPDAAAGRPPPVR